MKPAHAGEEFRIFGHRGARGHAPENTLLGLDTGIRLGAGWLECDLQRHPEGQLLLMHDLTVDRTTNGHGALTDLDFASLRLLDAGEGQQIPTLDEAMALVEQRAGLNIELKSADGTGIALAAALRDAIDRGWPVEKLLVSSFHLPELWEFKQAAPEIAIGALVAGVPLDWAAGAVELGAAALNIASDFADPRLIADAKKHGLKVYVYTVNDAVEMRALRKLGADGIFTDFPERALDAFA